MSSKSETAKRLSRVSSGVSLSICTLGCSAFFALTALGLLGAAGVGAFAAIFAPDRAMMAAAGRVDFIGPSSFLPVLNTTVLSVGIVLGAFGTYVAGKSYVAMYGSAAVVLIAAFLMLPRPAVMATAQNLADAPPFPVAALPVVALFWAGFVGVVTVSLYVHLRVLRR